VSRLQSSTTTTATDDDDRRRRRRRAQQSVRRTCVVDSRSVVFVDPPQSVVVVHPRIAIAIIRGWCLDGAVPAENDDDDWRRMPYLVSWISNINLFDVLLPLRFASVAVRHRLLYQLL